MARLVEQAKKKSKAQNLRLARALISKTRWLDQYPHYRKGRIEFIDTNQKKYELNSYLVSKTQRTINQIRKFGSLAGELLEEDLNAWLAKKESQLENAKKLVKTLEVPYPTKIESEESIAALLAYLEIESQCLLEEEMAVSTRLFKHKEISFPLLFEYIREYHHSPNSKALASLILGAIHREQQKKLKPSFERLEENKWIQDCYSFGLKHSLPS